MKQNHNYQSPELFCCLASKTNFLASSPVEGGIDNYVYEQFEVE